MGNNFTPAWIKKGFFNESLFCDDFLSTHQLLYSNGAFFTPEGRVTDTMNLRCEIFDMLRDHIGANIAKRVNNVVDVLKLAAQVDDFPPVTDRIALANGTLYLDGTFQEGKPEIVRNRIPVKYDPKAPQPSHWLRFLSDLLYPEDIPTVQEFIGYCLIPSNKGQRMMVIKGNGGEGKSQIGVVLSRLFGCNMKDGSIGKISENRFARADLEHTLLCVDDDMRMEALRQTNYVKSIVTAQGQMDLERKGKQSYQGWMYARLLAFSNGDLQALYDRSDGFYRRQLILTTKDKPLSRVDDPDIAEKMAAEVEGILLWAFEGLQRLVKNGFQFTESDRAKRNRELVKRDNNNVFDFLESEGYIRLKADACTSSKELYEVYRMWCEENSLNAIKARGFSDALIANQRRYNLESTNNMFMCWTGRCIWMKARPTSMSVMCSTVRTSTARLLPSRKRHWKHWASSCPIQTSPSAAATTARLPLMPPVGRCCLKSPSGVGWILKKKRSTETANIWKSRISSLSSRRSGLPPSRASWMS